MLPTEYPPAYLTEYAEVNRVLGDLLPRIQTIVGNTLVGIYLHGSLVYGDFDQDNSDIDLLVVTSAALNDEELASLQQMHQRFASDNPRWDDRIETAYLTTNALQTFRSHPSTIANISPGEPFHTLEAGKDWLVNWYLVRHQGIALFGPPPQSVIPPITQAEFIAVVRDHAKQWTQWVNDCRYQGSQAYAVLTLCRALYTTAQGETHGQQLSKAKAAAWAAQRYPQWAAFIQQALVWRAHSQEPVNAAEQATTFPETVRFVHFAIEQVSANHP